MGCMAGGLGFGDLVGGVSVSVSAAEGELVDLVGGRGYDFDLGGGVSVEHESGGSDHDDHVFSGAFFVEYAD